MRQFIFFVAVGGCSAVVSLLVRYGVDVFWPYEVAVAIAQIAGAIVAFTLNALFVFRADRDRLVQQFVKFASVNVISLCIVTAVSSILFRLLFPLWNFHYHPDLFAQIIGLAASTFPSFFGHKYFSFRSRGPKAE